MMKKLFIFLIALIPLLASAQEKMSVVTLKSGTELKGVIKAIDPTDALTIVIAGVEAKIKMSDVARVEELTEQSITANTSQKVQLSTDGKIIVTDKADYPESFDLKIGAETLKMILIRGGEMNMGFDGPGSKFMDSEPIHKVALTTFYISETFVTSAMVSEVYEKTSKKDYYKTSWKRTNVILDKIASKAGLPVRLPTEAEWEYAACSQEQLMVFEKSNDFEFCSDVFDEYKDEGYVKVDPTGPDKGSYHVIRAYSQKDGKFNRKAGMFSDYYFRIAIKAKDVKL